MLRFHFVHFHAKIETLKQNFITKKNHTEVDTDE
jgi:hypothetical protein